MNPDAVLTFTPFDVRFSRWLYQHSGWSTDEKDQVLAEYLAVRGLEQNDPEDTAPTLAVIGAFEERERLYEASLMPQQTFRQHEIAFHAGWWGNTVAAHVALIVDRLGDGGLDLGTPSHRAKKRANQPTHYQFSLN